MANVILLRTPEEGTDSYESALSASGYHPISIPALETSYANISTLRDIIREGPKQMGFTGVLISSKRSCEAWKEALGLLLAPNLEPRASIALAGWGDIPFYVVGETTASALREAFWTYGDPGIGTLDIRGQSSGAAAALGPFVLEDLHHAPANLLYLTGDKNRDTLSQCLSNGGIHLELLQVYKTDGCPTFENRLIEVLSSVKQISDWWIVYFAPSGGAFVTPMLEKYFLLEKTNGVSNGANLKATRIAAIGPTTHSFLHGDLGMKVDAMAQKPTPQGVVASIISYDRDHPVPQP